MGKYEIINSIREYKEKIEERITKLSTKTSDLYYVTIEVMTESWIIKGNIDFLRKWLYESYFVNDEITHNQYRLIYKYLKKYENDVWSRLYDIAAKNDK